MIDLSGLGVLIFVGAGTLLVGFVVLPPAVVVGLAFVLRSEIDLLWLWTWSQGLWAGYLVAHFVFAVVQRLIRQARAEREHREFMALRDRFYDRREVCTETLAQLRARAAAELRPGEIRS